MARIKLGAGLEPRIAGPAAIPSGSHRAVGIALGALGLGLLVAGLCLAPQPVTVGIALLGVGLPVIVLLWYRPEFGLLAILFLACSLVPSDVVDMRLPIGGGLELRDLALVGMLALLILRGLIHKSLTIPWERVSAPLLVFLGFALFSALYALFYQHVEANWALSDLRALIFYSTFFVTGWAVTGRRQLETVLVGLFLIADLVAGVVILQQFLGTNHPLLAAMSVNNWRLYDVQEIGGAAGFGMVRIMPPGVVLVYFMMVLALCLMVFAPSYRHLRPILAVQFAYLNLGLLLTYTRALWIAAVIAMGLILVALYPAYKAHLVRYFLIVIPVLGLLVGVAVSDRSIRESELVTASVQRLFSILKPEDTLESYSLQWRVFENREGLRSVSEHPLLGVGLGNRYRAVTTLQGEDIGWVTGGNVAAGEISRFTRFLHNSYLSIAVKMGLPAFASFLWFCVALALQSARLYRQRSEGKTRSIALAVLASFVGLMLWSVFHQHFIQTESTAVVGLMAGLAASRCRGLDGPRGSRQLSPRAPVRLHA